MEIYEKVYEITEPLCSCAGLLHLAQEAAGEHSTNLGFSWEQLQAQGLFWAVIRTKAEITRLPKAGETLTARTWPLPTTRTAYPRQVRLLDEAGQEVAQVLSLWVLMDVASRRMVLPGKSGITVEGITLGCELELPGSLTPVTQGERRTVTVTDDLLDRNGHMNNAKYLQWVQAAAGDRQLAGFTLNYLAEALPGDELELICRETETGLNLDILKENTRIFSANALFK